MNQNPICSRSVYKKNFTMKTVTIKEVLLFLMIVFVSCSWSNATTQFQWFNIGGCAVTVDGSPLGSGHTVLTYLSSSSTPQTWDDVWTSSTDGGFYGVSGTESMIFSGQNTVAGSYWTAPYSGPGDGFRVYAVVLDLDWTTFQASGVPNGTRYDITSVTYGPLPTAPPSPALAINGETLAINNTSGTIFVIPEPSTMVLLACGMGVDRKSVV